MAQTDSKVCHQTTVQVDRKADPDPPADPIGSASVSQVPIEAAASLVRERTDRLSGRMTVDEIARRLDLGRLAVYTMLEQGLLPGIRLGRRWLITRHAYEQWERTCGTGLQGQTEVTV